MTRNYFAVFYAECVCVCVCPKLLTSPSKRYHIILNAFQRLLTDSALHNPFSSLFGPYLAIVFILSPPSYLHTTLHSSHTHSTHRSLTHSTHHTSYIPSSTLYTHSTQHTLCIPPTTLHTFHLQPYTFHPPHFTHSTLNTSHHHPGKCLHAAPHSVSASASPQPL